MELQNKEKGALIIIDELKSIIDNDLLKEFVSIENSWDTCVKREVAFITITKKSRKFSIIHYDLYPCYGLETIHKGISTYTKHKFKFIEREELEYDIRGFYNYYMNELPYAIDKRMIQIGGSTCEILVNSVHAKFIADRLSKYVSSYVHQNRVINDEVEYEEEDLDFDQYEQNT